MSFKTELKKELTRLNYPIEISEYCLNGRIKHMGRDIITKEGISIKRQRISLYRPSMGIRKYAEYIEVNPKNFIDIEKLKEIVTRVFDKYAYDYMIYEVNVVVVDDDGRTILDLYKKRD